MNKWIRITKKYWFGLFVPGLAAFFLQEFPYIIMPLFSLDSNPLMEMADKLWWLNAAEKAAGISCVILMLFLVREDAKWFSLQTKRERLGFFTALAALLGYYIGWTLYFNGHQSLAVMLGFLVALPPVFYAFIGVWRKNTPLTMMGMAFLFIHFTNVCVNMLYSESV